MVERINIRVDGAEGRAGSVVPMYVYGDPSKGPTVSLMAGVHGCEYTSMLGLRRFLDGLDESTLRGSLRVVPMANGASFAQRTPFVVPHDGRNLNRCFPGDAGGSFTDRLAHALFEAAIRPSDYHIDMHAGDMVEALEPFTIYDASEVEQASRQLAFTHGLGYTVRSTRSESPIAGTSSAAAAEAGIPSITAEAGGCGVVDEPSVRLHEDGVRRVLASLGVVTGTFGQVRDPIEMQRWIWLRAASAGWWTPLVAVGEWVAAGSVIGSVRELDGGFLETIVAPEDGVPLFMTTSPAVADDGLLLGLAIR